MTPTRTRVLKTLSFSFFTLASVFSSSSLIAEESFSENTKPTEEVLVSGFRNETSLKAPISVTSLNSELIEEVAEQHFQELTELVPNLNWSGGVNRPRYFQIRGIGERSQYEGAPNPSVGFVIDDVDFSGLGGIATLYDVDQVEVLRGPQGTRLGANALAGLIYIKYQEPTDEFESNFSTSFGSDGLQTYGTAFGGPLSDSIKYRAVIHQHKSNGFRDNSFLNLDDTNGRDELSARLKLNYQPGANWNFDLSLFNVDIDNGYDAFAIDNSFTTQSNRPGQDTQKTKAFSLNSTAALNDSIHFESITGAARSDIIFSFDADWGNDELWAPVIYDYFSVTQRDRQNLSQEVRLLSAPDAGLIDGSLDWVTGFIVANNKESNDTIDDGNFEGFTSLDRIIREYEASNFALFADLKYQLSNQWSLNAGLRFEDRDAKYSDTANDSFDTKEESIGGQIALNYSLNDATKAYAKIARGYKAGGFNLGLPANASQNDLLFDAEYLWNYELGLKGSAINDRLAYSGNIFYMQRNDQQVQSSRQLTPGDPSSFIFFTDNAGEGSNYGLEAELNFTASDKLDVYTNIGFLQTEIKKLATAPAREGRDQAHAPNYTFAIGGRYQFTDNWFARIDISGKDKFYFSDSHDQVSKAYSLTNLRLGYDADNWSVSAWARNVFDKKYAVRGFFFGNEPARSFADTLYTRQGDPQQFGFSFDYHYGKSKK